MTTVLLHGQTSKGTLALLVADASWATIASVADGLQSICTEPITWEAHATTRRSLHGALAEVGLLDRPLATVA
jgi:hypothetical protein